MRPLAALAHPGTAPATSQSIKDGKTVTTTRELVAYLKLEKIAQKPVVKKAATTTKGTPKTTTTTKSRTRKR